MGPAKVFSALVALGVIMMADAQSPATAHCPPCSKIRLPVCGVDDDGEIWTFPNSCTMVWCNCMLRAADSDRKFKELTSGSCEGSPSNETEIPECFPEMDTTTESTDDGPEIRILNTTKATPAAGAGLAPGAALAVAAVVATLVAAGDFL
ncbi:uncharacterized protein LOC126414084 [Schistocerca serialis cubense]|uniref:uncharacterized protein LOC126414084 n=1 Tax=Schistocerca serialis cubense TaxID=2023355 RepID=UPI00214ECB0F|nr:uncharacterized protein LOC126414084 [Schistocerca serialis cubense]